MKKLKIIASSAILATLIVTLSGCYKPGFATNVEVSNDEAKNGKSTCRVVFGIPFGKCTIDAAVRKAGIKQIQAVDYSSFNILFYMSRTTHVRGK